MIPRERKLKNYIGNYVVNINIPKPSLHEPPFESVQTISEFLYEPKNRYRKTKKRKPWVIPPIIKKQAKLFEKIIKEGLCRQ